MSPLRSDISQSLVEGGHDSTKLASIFEIGLICVLRFGALTIFSSCLLHFFMFQAHPFLPISQTVNLIFQLLFRSSAFAKEKVFFLFRKRQERTAVHRYGVIF